MFNNNTKSLLNGGDDIINIYKTYNYIFCSKLLGFGESHSVIFDIEVSVIDFQETVSHNKEVYRGIQSHNS
jgi:hypothetical protein